MAHLPAGSVQPLTFTQRLDAYERLMRLDQPIGALLLLWPALWSLWLSRRAVPELDVLVIFLLGVVLMRSAGCVINDCADRRFDPYVERTRDRPLAAGIVSMRDLTAAVWAALEPGRAQHGVYQIGSGVETAITDLLARLGDLAQARLGRRPRVEHRPPRAGEVTRNFADPGLARRELGWTPTTPLDRGLTETFDWFLAQRKGATIR